MSCKTPRIALMSLGISASSVRTSCRTHSHPWRSQATTWSERPIKTQVPTLKVLLVKKLRPLKMSLPKPETKTNHQDRSRMTLRKSQPRMKSRSKSQWLKETHQLMATLRKLRLRKRQSQLAKLKAKARLEYIEDVEQFVAALRILD